MLIIILGTIGYIAAGVLLVHVGADALAGCCCRCCPTAVVTLSPGCATAVAAFRGLSCGLVRQAPIALLVAFDVLMLTAGFLVYHYVVEE